MAEKISSNLRPCIGAGNPRTEVFIKTARAWLTAAWEGIVRTKQMFDGIMHVYLN